MQELSTITFEFLFKSGSTVEDLSALDDVLLRFEHYQGTTFDRTKLLGQISWKTDGTDGIAVYTFTIAEALEGEWDVHGKITDGAVVLWSNVRSFYLNPNI